jgi:transcriptional regulator with XRE-family HTH domain
MRKQTLGMIISSLRKEKGMTQLELAEKMRVTDKAVSKWVRDLSFPDINSIPKLAEIFEVSVDDLMQVKTNTKETIGKNK